VTLTEILETLYHDGPTGIQSRLARLYDTHFAALCSMGLISSLGVDGRPTRQWRLTHSGTFHLNLQGQA
jgi:hypothetical protein